MIPLQRQEGNTINPDGRCLFILLQGGGIRVASLIKDVIAKIARVSGANAKRNYDERVSRFELEQKEETRGYTGGFRPNPWLAA